MSLPAAAACTVPTDSEAVDFVSHIVTMLAPRCSPSLREELMAEGLLGYAEAARRFDRARGVRDFTYASHRVKGRIMDALREHGRLGARTTAGSMEWPYGFAPPRSGWLSNRTGTSGDRMGQPGEERTLESTLTARELALVLGGCLRQLREGDRYLVVQCLLHNRPVREVARQSGLSRNRVEGRLRRASAELRRALRNEGYSLADFR